MKVNSVASYNNQSQNRTNVKFGDCKKIVCRPWNRDYMAKAIEAFENSSWKQELDQKYDYEVHFLKPYVIFLDWFNKPWEPQYRMVLKPYKPSLLKKLKKRSKESSNLPNLPGKFEMAANYLATELKFTIYDKEELSGLAERAKKYFSNKQIESDDFLVYKIMNLSFKEIMEKISKTSKA